MVENREFAGCSGQDGYQWCPCAKRWFKKPGQPLEAVPAAMDEAKPLVTDDVGLFVAEPRDRNLFGAMVVGVCIFLAVLLLVFCWMAAR